MEFLPADIEDYALMHSSPESELLARLNRETHLKVLSPRMLSGHMQGRILSLLSKLLNPELILEVGTYTGYSALCMAEGLREDGKLHTIDVNEELQEMCRRYFDESGYGKQIVSHLGDARNIIPEIPGIFDLVFIDADKENYQVYFNLVADRMRRGGLIIADNVLWSGKVVKLARENDKDTRALQTFNDVVCKDPRFEALLLPVRDGLMILRRI